MDKKIIRISVCYKSNPYSDYNTSKLIIYCLLRNKIILNHYLGDIY